MDLERHLVERGIDYRVAIFEGRHGWPPGDYTNRALDWMELQAIKRGLAAENPALIDAELTSTRREAAEAEDPLQQLRRHRDVVRDFGGLREVTADLEAVRRLETDPRVEQRRSQEKKLAKAEHSYRATRLARWVADVRTPERRPPTVRESLTALRVGPLTGRAAGLTDPAYAHAAQRTLEDLYTAVASSLPGEFETAGDFDRSVRCLEIAVAIFPKRARGHWLLAAAYVRARRHGAAVQALRTATSFGKVDLERLQTDPTWDPLRQRPGWAELIASLEERDG